MQRRLFTQRVLVGLGVSALSPAAFPAADFPWQTVRVIVPFPPGGATDTITRLVATQLAKRWGQGVVVENRGGASGTVGSAVAARAAADGYTLLATTGGHTVNPAVFRNLPYDTARDFTPITTMADTPYALVGSVKAGMTAIEVFLSAARSNPGKLSYGTTESTSRLIGVLFQSGAGIQVDEVPYKGAAPMLQDLVGGHVPVGFTSPLSAMALHQAGSVRILAVTGERRLATLPDVPTLAEVGVSGLTYKVWFALFGPAGLQNSIALKIREHVVAVLAEPEVAAKIRQLAGEPGGEPVDVFARRVTGELAMWRKTAQSVGIQPE